MDGLLTEISQKTLESQVLDRLREAIVEGVFKPDSQINQVQVAAQFKTSRGPIRAALNKLEEEGLVVNIPHRGTFVTPLNQKIVSDIYGVRSVLEAYGVRLAISRMNEADFQALHEIYKQMQCAAQTGDIKNVINLDFELHKALIEKSNNRTLIQSWSLLQIQVRRILAFRYFSHPYLQEMVDSHTELIELARQGDADLAAKVMEKHILEASADLLANWGKHFEFDPFEKSKKDTPD
jgi:DNA-binding GntR family transcriptional regulator